MPIAALTEGRIALPLAPRRFALVTLSHPSRPAVRGFLGTALLGLVLGLVAALLVPDRASAAPAALQNPSLETGAALPDCWQPEPFGAAATESAGFVTPGHDGARGYQVSATGLAAGANRKLVVEKSETCAPAVTPGATHRLSLWYWSTSADAALQVFFHHAGGWGGEGYTVTYAPPLPATGAGAWTQASFEILVRGGADQISFGLGLFADGQLAVDDVSLTLTEAAPPGEEPPAPGTGPGIVEEVNIDGLNQPTAVEFLPDGKVVVSEKPGVIKIFDSLAGGNLLHRVAFEDRVSSFGDFGLTSLAYTGGFLFATYQYGYAETVDSCPNLGSPDSDNPNDTDGCPSSGRLVKYAVAADGALGPEQVVLEGRGNFCFQYITHGVDALEVDPRDGTLLMSIGDGANFNVVDNGQYADPCGAGPPNGGAFRSQADPADPGAGDYDGKVIRIDPATGAVLRVEAKGLRNPFRMSFASDSLYVSDTGWGAVEEFNLLPLGGVTENFGWPCFEGNQVQTQYAELDNPVCDTLTHTPPVYDYIHPAENGRRASITAIEELGGKVYFGDVTLEFIKVYDPATGAEPETVVSGESVNPVDLKRTPGGGLVYVDIGVVNVGASAIDENTGSIEAVIPGTIGPPSPAPERPSAEILLQQDPYTPGGEVPFAVEVTGFRGQLDYQWTVTLVTCNAAGTDCERRALDFEGQGERTGAFVGPDDAYPATVELSVVATNTLNGTTVSDTASISRVEDAGPPPGAEPPPTAGAVSRIAGTDRIATAVEVSRQGYEPGAPVAYVARADDFPDALAAGPLAAATRGPILLTPSTELAAATAAELARLTPAKVVVLGGTQAVSAEVEAAIAAAHPTERLAGGTRFETAAAITGRLGPVDTVYVATGERFPDALVGGVAAGLRGGGVLLTGATDVPDATTDLLAQLAPAEIVLLGGEQAASAAVQAELAALGATRRVFGATRYETAVAVSQATFAGTAGIAYVATGEAFPDALSIAPTTVRDGGALLLTTSAALPAAVVDELVRLDPAEAVVVGGEAAVSAAVEAALAALLAP